ncbi:hypothetical protein [Serpentinimonas maccroryi]|uniref:hypothetical protein n=1 Tax=Serpentinimonas maccroryi TaxID=1458426 RepID=UPI002033C744|nr:hypothetical protein [Serpentinimonas maccroryi]MCM2479861.1 hypothetical protein [Serpentinimonas maccroryi]
MSSNKVVCDTPIQDARRDEIDQDIVRTATVLSASETVQRYGSATSEYIKGYRGVDNETGQRFAKGLADIAKHKVNDDPCYAAQNIKQQAGYSAEVAATSRDNAESIISGSKVRTSRADDLPQYGKNHNVVDRAQLLDGQVIKGSQSQMKFVGNRNKLLDDIARKDGKFTRYQGTKLELPSEQFDGAADYCREQAQQRRMNAEKAEAKGSSKAAFKLRREAENYDELALNVSDSGLTTEDAIYYREHPELATWRDIGRTAHRGGLEGAKYGAIIGVSISLLQSCLAAAQGKKDIGETVKDLGIDTAKAGTLGYATGFAGSAIKGGMQQSDKLFLRQAANTSAPTLVVNICLSLSGSIKRYVAGEISEAQLLTEVGEKGAGMLSSGMMAALGQLAIPVPFVGAAIGGMIGYTLSSMFYQTALDAARGADLSREHLARVRVIEAAARERINHEQAQLDEFVRREIPKLQLKTQQLLAEVSRADNCDVDTLAASINQYATLLGKQLQFQTMSEFDDFMSSDRQLAL